MIKLSMLRITTKILKIINLNPHIQIAVLINAMSQEQGEYTQCHGPARTSIS